MLIFTFTLVFLPIEARFSFILNVRSHSTTGSCDPWPAGECETYFSLFCLRGSSAEQSAGNTQYCPLGANRERLERQTGTRIISSNQPWPATFQLFIQAWDDDLIKDDLLDNIFIEGSLINSELSPVKTVTGSMSRVTMTVQFRRVCDENYYNVSCSTHCVAADDNTLGHYTCNPNNGSKQCLLGYEGQDCLQNTNDCLPDSCINGGDCTDLLSDFTCNCPPGFTGKNCSIDIDECADNSCPGNSTCEDYVNEYTCVCNYGYTGHNCTQVIDPCEYGSCVNGGTCVAVDSFTSMCVCPTGYTGPVCELNIDNCLNASCPLGTSCLDGNNTFKCLLLARDLKTLPELAGNNSDVVISSVVAVTLSLVLGVVTLTVILIFIVLKRRNKYTERDVRPTISAAPKLEETGFNAIYGQDISLVSPKSLSPSGSFHVFDNSLYTELESHMDSNMTGDYQVPVTSHPILRTSQPVQMLADSCGYDQLQHQ